MSANVLEINNIVETLDEKQIYLVLDYVKKIKNGNSLADKLKKELDALSCPTERGKDPVKYVRELRDNDRF